MSDAFGGDFISISDENGNEYELEHLDTMEINGVYYLAFVPADIDENDERYGLVILKKETENDEYLTMPDEDEMEGVYEKFMERLFDENEE